MRWIAALLAAVVGAGLGLTYGWIVNPVSAADTAPSSLRIDYRTDYVLMVAETYRSTQDVESAKRQLAILGDQPPAEMAAAAADRARLANYAPEDLAALEDLVRALASAGIPAPPGAAPP
jgi:hypothetical protein